MHALAGAGVQIHFLDQCTAAQLLHSALRLHLVRPCQEMSCSLFPSLGSIPTWITPQQTL